MSLRAQQSNASKVVDLISSTGNGRSWMVVSQLLSTAEGKSLSRDYQSPDGSRNTLLHLSCLNRAPVHVVRQIMRANPQASRLRNRSGQTPLHLAAASGSSPPVLRLLVEEFPKAASVTDSQGRTPLISILLYGNEDEVEKKWGASWLAGKNGTKSKRAGIPTTVAMMESVCLLCDVAPEAVGIEDENGSSALEYAILNKVDMNVVRLVMRRTKLELLAKVAEERAKEAMEFSTQQRSLSISAQVTVA